MSFPRLRWTRLYRALEPYLKPVEEGAGIGEAGAGRLDYYHDQLRFAVFQRWLDMPAPDAEASEAFGLAHRQLAGYFHRLAAVDTPPGDWRTDAVRGLSELPHHLARGSMWLELETTLCDLRFIAAKCAAGMTYDLVADYDEAVAALPEGREEQEKQRHTDEQLRRYARDLVEYARKQGEADRRRVRASGSGQLPAPEDVPVPAPPAAARMWTDKEVRRDTERIARAPTRLERLRAFGQFVRSDSHHLADPWRASGVLPSTGAQPRVCRPHRAGGGAGTRRLARPDAVSEDQAVPPVMESLLAGCEGAYGA